MFEEEHEDENEESEETREVVKDRAKIVPRTSMMSIRDLAKRPLFARAILFLYEHGVVQQVELYEALQVTQGTISAYMKRLIESGIVRRISRAEAEGFVFDRRYVYYELPENVRQNRDFITELKKCYEYQCLKTIERVFTPYEWADVAELKENERFLSTIDRLGLTFEDALRLITRYGIFYVDKDKDGKVLRFKRAFDNYSRRVPKEQTESPKKTYAKREEVRVEEDEAEEVII